MIKLIIFYETTNTNEFIIIIYKGWIKMENNETVEKKIISENTAVKAFINGFISYGFIFAFIIFMGAAFFKLITQNIEFKNDLTVAISTSLLGAIILYFGTLFLCRLSTFDVLKKCKLNKENIQNINKKMSIFFILCAIISFLICLMIITTRYQNSTLDFQTASENYYNAFKADDIEIANSFINQFKNELKDDWSKFITTTSILEGTIVFSCFYLIIYQKKMITLYNN